MKGKITVPECMKLSKNSTHGIGANGQVFVYSASKADMYAISIMIRPPFYGYKWTSEPVYVRIMVFREDMRGDPQNFVDAICDAVKVGIGVDDNVYKGSWNWEIDKENPRIEIEVEQFDANAEQEVIASEEKVNRTDRDKIESIVGGLSGPKLLELAMIIGTLELTEVEENVRSRSTEEIEQGLDALYSLTGADAEGTA